MGIRTYVGCPVVFWSEYFYSISGLQTFSLAKCSWRFSSRGEGHFTISPPGHVNKFSRLVPDPSNRVKWVETSGTSLQIFMPMACQINRPVLEIDAILSKCSDFVDIEALKSTLGKLENLRIESADCNHAAEWVAYVLCIMVVCKPWNVSKKKRPKLPENTPVLRIEWCSLLLPLPFGNRGEKQIT